MGVKNIKWHMVLCVDDRGRGRVGVVDLRRKGERLRLCQCYHWLTLDICLPYSLLQEGF